MASSAPATASVAAAALTAAATRSSATATIAAASARSLAPLPEAAVARVADLGADGWRLLDLVSSARRLLVVTGAGISTASGIPDYRSPSRPAYKPLQHRDFMDRFATRRRYWARSMIGYGRMGGAAPNAGHHALAALQRGGLLWGLITQNVDRLHQAAGSTGVLELHGSIHEVECLGCGRYAVTRAELQQALVAANDGWLAEWVATAAPRPDGDVELPDAAYESFAVPTCPLCGSDMLKPRVVFYGGNVPAPVTEASLELARSADVMLAVGTTLSTWSAYRLAKATVGGGGQLGIVNYGTGRADDLATVRVGAHISSVLGALAAELLPSSMWPPPPPPAAAAAAAAATDARP
jgi:NAD+-dependent protein deacetylase sirtuin 4